MRYQLHKYSFPQQIPGLEETVQRPGATFLETVRKRNLFIFCKCLVITLNIDTMFYQILRKLVLLLY